ncbi:MAG: TetR family transcriptional regulator [Bdellovibrio sp.]|nr:TetR family transcriptional regulator [Bdellovibrio sp.]
MSASSDSKLGSRKSIIDVATKLFAKLGIDKCSTREIAKESDSNISLISYYFGGKEGLYKEVMRKHALDIKEGTKAIFDDATKGELTKELFTQEIKQMIDMMIRLRVKNPEMAQIFAREKLCGMPHSRQVHEEIFYPMITRFFTLFKQAQQKKIVQPDINAALFFVSLSEGIWGFFEMFACNTQLNKDFENLADDHLELRNQFLKIYLTGVLV